MAPVVVELGAQSGLDHPADRGAPVRLLLRDHGRHHAARWGWRPSRRRRSRARTRSQTGIQGSDLRAAHGDPAVHLDLQPAAAADRRARRRSELVRVVARLHAGHAAVRRAHDELVPRAQPAVGDRCCWPWPWCCCSGPTSSWTASRRSTATTPAAEVFEVAQGRCRTNDRVVMVIKGTTIEGDDVDQDRGAAARRRPAPTAASAWPTPACSWCRWAARCRSAQVKFGSRAQKCGFEQGWDVAALKVPTDRPTPHWFYLPALLLARWCGGTRAAHAAAAAARRRLRCREGRRAAHRADPRAGALGGADQRQRWRAIGPRPQRMNLLDDSLSADLARAGRARRRDDRRFLALGDYAVGDRRQRDPVHLLGVRPLHRCGQAAPSRACRCSSRTRRWSTRPRPGARRRRIGLVASFAPTLASMPAGVPGRRAAAHRAGRRRAGGAGPRRRRRARRRWRRRRRGARGSRAAP